MDTTQIENSRCCAHQINPQWLFFQLALYLSGNVLKTPPEGVFPALGYYIEFAHCVWKKESEKPTGVINEVKQENVWLYIKMACQNLPLGVLVIELIIICTFVCGVENMGLPIKGCHNINTI